MSWMLIFASGIYLIFVGLLNTLNSFIFLFVGRKQFDPRLEHYIFLFFILYFFLAVWLIATGVGIVLKKRWARNSLIVISVLTLLLGLVSLVIVINPSDKKLEFAKLLFISLFFIIIPLFFLTFFNKKHIVNGFFGGKYRVSQAEPALGIKFISLLSFFSALYFFLNIFNILFQRIETAIFLGFYLEGTSVIIYYILLAAINLYIALSLLRLQRKGWLTAVFYHFFILLNNITNAIFLKKIDVKVQEAICKLGYCDKPIPLSFLVTVLFLGILFVTLVLIYLISKRAIFLEQK